MCLCVCYGRKVCVYACLMFAMVEKVGVVYTCVHVCVYDVYCGRKGRCASVH